MSEKDFFFDKTDLFNRLSRIETILGLNNSFDADDISNRISVIEIAISELDNKYATVTDTDNRFLRTVNKLGDSLLGNLALLVQPTDNNHLVTKQYVDTIIADLGQLEADLSIIASKEYVDTQLTNKVSKFGDTLYGELLLSDNATKPLHPVSKQQFDASLNNVAITGNLDW